MNMIVLRMRHQVRLVSAIKDSSSCLVSRKKDVVKMEMAAIGPCISNMGVEQRASQPASNQQDLICRKAEAVIGQDWI